mmetsp:Transcript_7682/g.14285  ORF Transcript_7682/g.14285 Transcript_7682/m.14285 type:complete len:225 (-) Transcript_7682:330-1004(-)
MYSATTCGPVANPPRSTLLITALGETSSKACRYKACFVSSVGFSRAFFFKRRSFQVRRRFGKGQRKIGCKRRYSNTWLNLFFMPSASPPFPPFACLTAATAPAFATGVADAAAAVVVVVSSGLFRSSFWFVTTTSASVTFSFSSAAIIFPPSSSDDDSFLSSSASSGTFASLAPSPPSSRSSSPITASSLSVGLHLLFDIKSVFRLSRARLRLRRQALPLPSFK